MFKKSLLEIKFVKIFGCNKEKMRGKIISEDIFVLTNI